MLTLYRRHLMTCSHRSEGRKWSKCKCPIWVQGTLGGESVRKSLDLTSWEAASNLLLEWNSKGEIGASAVQTVSVREGIDKFLEDARARHLRPSTLKVLESILLRHLLPWCEKRGYRSLKQLDLQKMTDYRAAWKDAPITAYKRLERLRTFFRYAQARGWVKSSPVAGLRPPKVVVKGKEPFSPEEISAMLEAADTFTSKGKHGALNKLRVKAFVLVLRYSGLRISDVVQLKPEHIKDGKIFLYQHKTGGSVWIPVPEIVTNSLLKIKSGEYYFWSGSGTLKSAISSWDRSLRILFRKAKVKKGSPHRFRTTLAVSLLSSGVSVDTVAMILGNTPAICLKHYRPWIKSLQEHLEAEVRKTWPSNM